MKPFLHHHHRVALTAFLASCDRAFLTAFRTTNLRAWLRNGGWHGIPLRARDVRGVGKNPDAVGLPLPPRRRFRPALAERGGVKKGSSGSRDPNERRGAAPKKAKTRTAIPFDP
jgi:hypothetical protein